MKYGLQRRIRVILDGVGILRPLDCSSCFLIFLSLFPFPSIDGGYGVEWTME